MVRGRYVQKHVEFAINWFEDEEKDKEKDSCIEVMKSLNKRFGEKMDGEHELQTL